MRRIFGTAGAAMIVCAAAACVGPRKTLAQQAADHELADRVEAALGADQMLYARHVTVRADNGVVTLDGYVWTPEELDAAKRDARRVSGVTGVVDRIEVDRGGMTNSPVAR
jgi:osmotically-inducible protein OsmY